MEQPFNQVYVGLGGNIGDSVSLLTQALDLITEHPAIMNLVVSRFYRTLPVSPILQADYINAVCRFNTQMGPLELLYALQHIECKLGKVPKSKYDPRVIDCDILFYGNEAVSLPQLKIPHPHWRERLFVLAPLADLVDRLQVPGILLPLSLHEELQTFTNTHNEIVVPLEVKYEKNSSRS